MFEKILIANRGEIACRIIQSCQKLGVKTVAIYSDIDKKSLFVQQADEAYCLGSAKLEDSYLNIDKIIQIAKHSQAEAIHPGYGFLSENALFAKKCQQNNLIFIGPRDSSIELMACKRQAKALMEKADVPIVPGFNIDDQTEAELLKLAEQTGFPLLIKAANGGGGKGMKLVHQQQDFIAAIASAKREALKSFGNDTLLVEKYLKAPRHIEVQVFADNFGNTIHLFERDCSIQRRHQKIIEEAPAINIKPVVRQALHQAAINAAKAINYSGAGTIEFLLEDDHFYFMEMNTRLQVEHPVTEAVTQLDLVEWQLRIAANQPLPKSQDQILCHGHAVEVRLYAEDPDKDFLPQTGKISQCQWPAPQNDIRIDTGVKQGDEISVHYDPMIAKIISFAISRQAAIKKMDVALQHTLLAGLTTNLNFLKAILQQHAFQQGQLSTHYLADNPIHYQTTPKQAAQYLASYLLLKQNKQHSPWLCNDAWQANLKVAHPFKFAYQDQKIEIQLQKDNASNFICPKQNTHYQAWIDNDTLYIEQDNKQIKVKVIQESQQNFHVLTDDQHYQFSPYIADHQADEQQANSLMAPMPGTVTAINCQTQQNVEKGQLLIIVEAMKMEHRIEAPIAGKIESVYFEVGDQVSEGELLIAMAQDK